MQSTGLKRDTIDKFYTKLDISKKCCDLFKQHIYVIPKLDIILEPSAGNGSFIPFLKPLCETCLFYDIEPEASLIVKQDYLQLFHQLGVIYHLLKPSNLVIFQLMDGH